MKSLRLLILLPVMLSGLAGCAWSPVVSTAQAPAGAEAQPVPAQLETPAAKATARPVQVAARGV